jgi:hypothetical protein
MNDKEQEVEVAVRSFLKWLRLVSPMHVLPSIICQFIGPNEALAIVYVSKH